MQKQKEKKAISFDVVIDIAKIIKAIAWVLIALSILIKSC